MRQYTRKWPLFMYYDRTGLEKYLERQAGKGWLLDDCTFIGWRFRRIAPQKLHFYVAYLPKDSAYNAEFCYHAGWKVAAEDERRRFFYTDQTDPTPVETDPAMELENIHRTTKRQLLGSFLLWILIALTQIMIFSAKLEQNFRGTLADPISLTIVMIYSLILLTHLLNAASYLMWYGKAKRNLRLYGIPTETNCNARLQQGLGLGMTILWLLLLDMKYSFMMVLIFAVILGILWLLSWAERLFSPWYPRKKEVLSACGVVLVLVLIALTPKWVTAARENGWVDLTSNSVNNSLVGKVLGWEDLEAPLLTEDLLGEVDSDQHTSWRGDESLLLGMYKMYQYGGQLDLEYTVTKVKAQFLYEYCRAEAMIEGYQEMNAVPWGAGAAYCRIDRWGDHCYLLCYDTIIVELKTERVLTGDEIVLAGQKFSRIS